MPDNNARHPPLDEGTHEAAPEIGEILLPVVRTADSSSSSSDSEEEGRKANYNSPSTTLTARHNWLIDASVSSVLKSITGIDRRAGIGHQRSLLIHPDYPFIQYVNILSTFFLIYVAIVVQVEVGFFWSVGILVYTYIYACMRACVHTYIHTYIYTCLPTYMPTYNIYTYMFVSLFIAVQPKLR